MPALYSQRAPPSRALRTVQSNAPQQRDQPPADDPTPSGQALGNLRGCDRCFDPFVVEAAISPFQDRTWACSALLAIKTDELAVTARSASRQSDADLISGRR
jgi:hypothetical protein